MWNPMLQAALGAIFRYLLAGLFAVMVAKGVWTEAEAAVYLTGAVGFLITVSWAVWVKYRDRLKFLTGMASGAGVTENEVKEMVKEKKAPPATLQPDVAPYLNSGDK